MSFLRDAVVQRKQRLLGDERIHIRKSRSLVEICRRDRAATDRTKAPSLLLSFYTGMNWIAMHVAKDEQLFMYIAANMSIRGCAGMRSKSADALRVVCGNGACRPAYRCFSKRLSGY
jgi:hypothetical protein